MITRQLSISTPIFILIYGVQEVVVNQFRLPAGGFSVFLIFALVWAILSTPDVAAVSGFVSGLLMDLSPSASGPIGQWTLILLASSYAIAYFGSGNENVKGNPVGVTFFISTTVFFTEILFVITGALLGVQTGSFGQVLLTIFGITLWTLVITPICLTVFSLMHDIALDTRSKI
jgi:rod shape-determining protein MreD